MDSIMIWSPKTNDNDSYRVFTAMRVRVDG